MGLASTTGAKTRILTRQFPIMTGAMMRADTIDTEKAGVPGAQGRINTLSESSFAHRR
jgi:hypothetical protein